MATGGINLPPPPARIMVFVPYAVSSSALPSVVSMHLLYAKFCMQWCWAQPRVIPICPVMNYAYLPNKPLLKDTDYDTILLQTSYYEGKPPCFRDFKPWLDVCDEIWVFDDLGVSAGTKWIIESYKVRYISIKDIVLQALRDERNDLSTTTPPDETSNMLHDFLSGDP